MITRRKVLLVAVLAAFTMFLAAAGYAAAQSGTGGDGGPAVGQESQSGPGAIGRARLGRHLGAGEVVSFEGDTLKIKTLRGEERTVQVNDETKYRKEGNDASRDDVKVGEKVAVLVGQKPEEGQDPVAKAVLIGKPGNEGPGGPGGPLKGSKPIVGNVSALNGDTLTITTADGDKQVKLPAITNGMRIAVVQGEDGTVRAVMYNPPERPQGDQGPPPEDGDNA